MSAPGDVVETVDLVFGLAGESLPRDYRAALWDALAQAAPWLRAEPAAGLHPVRASEGGERWLLSRRSRLVLRVPLARADEAAALAGSELSAGGHPIRLGSARRRPIEPSPTVGAAFVVSGEAGELEHQQRLTAALRELGLPERVIFGRMTQLRAGTGMLTGSSVVVHQLGAAASLRLLHGGLGPHRGIGCGLFVPYKEIAGLTD
ncbi:MAG: type I-MYXAN CRISPR-associated protein Cas6/Cmx6 [Burkholderiaceae bacterium]|nr:type I-MYXAN CRISPR-associated protein Cas6/Cmx6 [Burkholderiaceae bacterium]